VGAIRLFLALVVAFDHWRDLVITPAGHALSVRQETIVKLGFNAGYAVLFFYVISGFLIAFTLRHNYDAGRAGALPFYRNRFVRIFSLYWPMIAISFLV
jgi:peptidoglycan/LPS O-acetylase OafA/YrhL